MTVDRRTSVDAHVPILGELISPASGSALVTVATSLARARVRAGGRATVVGRDGRPHSTDVPLTTFEIADPVELGRTRKALEFGIAELTGRAPLTQRLWSPVVAAMQEQTPAYVFLHNAPAATTSFADASVQPVVYVHNEVLRGWSNRRRRVLLDRAPVVAVSRFLAERTFGPHAHRVLALVNGVDTDTFIPSDPIDEPVVLFVGKIAPHKGPHLLVRAARQLFDEGLRFRVRFVGSALLSTTDEVTEYEREIRALAAPMGDWVEFVPFVDRTAIASTYQAASIGVVPSDWDEPCSLTAPEAMASGLACVVSSRGGLPEVCGDGAIYFESGNAADLAQRLRPLVTDAAVRAEAGARARRRAEEISWDRQYERLDQWLTNWRPGP